MPKLYRLAIDEKNIFETINSFFKKLLKENVVDSILLPQEAVNRKSVTQTLIKNENQVERANIFAPLLLSNSATLISQLTLDNPDVKLGAVMRSCEIRATIELVKLKQVDIDNLIIIGVDCMGTYESNIYQKVAEKFEDSQSLTKQYLSDAKEARASTLEQAEIRIACQGCEYPNPENADIAINFLGCDIDEEIFIQLSDKLDSIKPEGLGLVASDENSIWSQKSKACIEERTKFRDNLFKQVSEETKKIKGFLKALEHCRRCYNCRKECPICYCRECIFESNTFEHASQQYFEWAERKGRIRMPTDTLLFHLTRMNHMAISCVGCGQCTSACPNNIPIAEFFKSIGFKIGKLFDYKPGRSIDEENPQATFKEDEFPAVGEPEDKK